ncbi:MAG TPA: metalloregulator ArsR/SmtB family transcription factor [Sphingomicrobium sp.]|nr:metalloregulator ArsR/SmtB family transcription factor [Sphingomicrobium sp.]
MKALNDLAAKAADAAALLKSLANEQRLLILCHLATQGELSVSELGERLELSQSALSQHLARLRQERLVTFRRQSKTIHYKVSDPMAEDVLALLSDLFCPELAQPVTESSASRSIPGRGRARGGGKG